MQQYPVLKSLNFVKKDDTALQKCLAKEKKSIIKLNGQSFFFFWNFQFVRFSFLLRGFCSNAKSQLISDYPINVTVSNKKIHLAVFETCVFRVWATKKLFTSICILVWRAFRSGHEISWYLQKRCFARKKVSYWKKSAILKKKKKIHGSKV